MHKPNSIFEAASKILFKEAEEPSPEDAKVIASVKKAFPADQRSTTILVNLNGKRMAVMLARNR